MKMKTKTIVTGVLTVFMVVLVYTQMGATAAKESDSKAKVGEKAPDFELKDVYGKSFKLSEFRDKIVVLEWVNKDCPISRGAHKKGIMQETYKKFAEKDVVWIGIDTTAGRKPEDNRVYAAEMKLAYPILHDEKGKVGRMYNAKTTPHMYVIDKDGTLVYDGAIDDRGETNYVEEALKALLKEKDIAKPKTEPYGCSVKYPKGE
jgi:peroxiredoxin